MTMMVSVFQNLFNYEFCSSINDNGLWWRYTIAPSRVRSEQRNVKNIVKPLQRSPQIQLASHRAYQLFNLEWPHKMGFEFLTAHEI